MSDTTAEPLPKDHQTAALCWREGESTREVLLITSSHGRWIVPKGWPMRGKSDGEAAMIEAWEEAGVAHGNLTPEPLGKFMVHKHDKEGRELHLPTWLYALEVTELADDWPEKHRRERRWLSLDEAAETVTEPDLRSILRAF